MAIHKVIPLLLLFLGISFAAFVVSEQYADKKSIHHLTIADASQPVFSLLYIAQEKGFFVEEGVDVLFRPFTSGRDALQDTLDGNSDLATSYETPVVLQSLKGEKLSIVSSLHFSNKKNSMLAHKSSGIEKPSDLVGKTIAVPKNTNAEFFVNMFLASEGIELSEVKVIDVRPEDMVETFKQKRADAIAVWNPHLYRAKILFDENLVTRFYSTAYTEFSVLVGSKAVVNEKAEAINRLIKALVKAENYLAKNPQQSQDLIISRLTQHSSESIKGTWNDYQLKIKLNNVLLTILEQEATWLNKDLEAELPDFRASIDERFVRAAKENGVTLF